MRRRYITLAALVAGPLAFGCSDDPLSVQNKNNPNADALLSTTSGTETIVSKLIQQMFNGQYGSSNAIWPQTTVLGLESEATVANFGMNTRGAIPRLAISNAQGNDVQEGNNRDYSFLTRNAVLAARTVNALEAQSSSFPAAGLARNKAFSFFALGYGLGHMSLIYDSIAVVTPARAAANDTLPAFSAAAVANRTALEMMDSALAYANSAAASSGWTVPTLWLASVSAGPSRDEFVRMVRSFKARIRANFPRTPAEVSGVDWAAVYADATNGITADLVVALGPGKGWTNSWIQQAAVAGGWHQMPYWITGMADTSGAYATWLSQGLGNKQPFLIVTPDKRFPKGETRAAQQAFQDPIKAAPGVYFRNRPTGDDTPGAASGLSWYDNFRFYDVRQNSGTGNWVWFARAENDGLAAEAALRLGRVGDAIPLIDRTRVPNGLPSVAGLASQTATVPGGNACVPRVPVAGGTACGSLFEAMKYEKRMETAFTGYGAWFLDSRRWGDLIRGTAIEWPAPYQETDARSRPYYNNTRSAAGAGTYAFVP
jgi:hypothetical protein